MLRPKPTTKVFDTTKTRNKTCVTNGKSDYNHLTARSMTPELTPLAHVLGIIRYLLSSSYRTQHTALDLQTLPSMQNTGNSYFRFSRDPLFPWQFSLKISQVNVYTFFIIIAGRMIHWPPTHVPGSDFAKLVFCFYLCLCPRSWVAGCKFSIGISTTAILVFSPANVDSSLMLSTYNLWGSVRRQIANGIYISVSSTQYFGENKNCEKVKM